jgi:hypothetical protein
MTLYVTQVTIVLSAKVKKHILITNIHLSFNGVK